MPDFYAPMGIMKIIFPNFARIFPREEVTMKKIYYKHPDDIPHIGRAAVALGLFDGVHIGHRALIARTVEIARERGLVPAVFTFGEGGGLKAGTSRIYDEEERLSIFEELGIELAVIADFDSVSSLSPGEFVKNVLVLGMSASVALAGRNFRFGYRASGGGEELVSLMRESGGEGYILDIETYDLGEGEREVSSTRIRSLLAAGDVEDSALLLGAPYKLRSVVFHGRGIGRTYGYPTVNTPLREDNPLRHGVYHTRVKIGEKIYTGLTNVGVCPTFGARDAHAETFILDFSENIYGEEIEILFVGFIREERYFSSSEELALEISRNIKTVMELDRSEEV